MKKDKQIELRSEKVRNLIGQVPPMLLRYGISTIGISLLMLVVIGAFIPYQPSYNVELKIVQQENGTLSYTADIPIKAMEMKSAFNYVETSSTELPLPNRFRFESIEDTAFISANSVIYRATLLLENNKSRVVRLNEPVIVHAKIILNKKSILKWLLNLR